MLNKEQQEAVEYVSGPLSIIAGPGTGKTRVIAEKIRYLVEKKKFAPDSLLALTFTDKASKEMSQRVELDGDYVFEAKTFHSFAKEIIENYKHLFPQVDKDFHIITETDSLIFFLSFLDSHKLSSIEIKYNKTHIAYELSGAISKLKDFGISLNDLGSLEMSQDQKADLLKAYSAYEAYKHEENVLDYSDLLLLVLNAVKENDQFRKTLQEKFQYILVDEFQDTNTIQLQLLLLLSQGNITLVGDQKQSIYSFRGANFENTKSFEKEYPNVKKIYLKENYRSSVEVLDAINTLIPQVGSSQELLVYRNEEVGAFSLHNCSDEYSQIRFIIQRISEIQEKDPKASIGILTRRNVELKQLSKTLQDLGFDHSCPYLGDFFEEEPIRSILFLLKIIENPHESHNELFHLLTQLDIRKSSLQMITRKSSRTSSSLYEIITTLKDQNFEFERNGEYEELENFSKKLIHIKKLYDLRIRLTRLVSEIMGQFHYYEYALHIEDKHRIECLNTFISYVEHYCITRKNPTLSHFLIFSSYARKIEKETDDEIENSGVHLMSVHQAKGKEFDYVVLPFLNQKKFPLSFNKTTFEMPISQMQEEFAQEELRLFFVAISRAKKELDLISVKKFHMNKLPSHRSEFLSYFNCEPQEFSLDLKEFKTPKGYELKKNYIDEIAHLLIKEEYSNAKRKVDEYEAAFSTKKDLSYYFNKRDKISNSQELEAVELDPQSQVYSVSQLQMYDQCPRKYLYSYIYKIPSQSRHYFDFGTSIHTVLEKMTLEFDSSTPQELFYAQSIDLLQKEWIAKSYESADQEKEYFEKAIILLREFTQKHYEQFENTKRELVATEHQFLIEVQGKKVMGFIDRIDKVGDEYELMDYKTSNSMEPSYRLRSNMQLLVYSLALQKDYGKLPKHAALWYLIHDKISSTGVETSELKRVEEKIVELASKIEAKKFEPTPSLFGCKFCDFNSICEDSQSK